MDIRAHQLKAYEALIFLDKLCRDNNITYFLLAGSVLGAVRHKGFIPWDDDIDIGMTPDNIERFCSVFNSQLPKDFDFSHPDTNPKHPRFFGKIIYDGHHCIDVFPIVKTSDNPILRWVQWIENKILFAIYLRKVHHPPKFAPPWFKRLTIMFIAWILSLFVSREWILKRANKVLTRYNGTETKSYINICSKYSLKKELIKAGWLRDLKPIYFEDNFFPAFKDTDAYLSHLYGDYMVLPPVEARIPNHRDQVYKM